MEKFFKLKAHGTTVRREILAGLTTFVTMAYVLVVQPSSIIGFGPEQTLTDINGVVISRSAILIMCALISGIITLFMGLYANLPMALSCGMGSNFLLGMLVQSGQVSYGWAMALLAISGTLFILITILGIRDLVVRIIPKNIKIGTSVVVGFFIAYLGFKNSGIGNFEKGISMGDFTNPAVALAVGCLALIAILYANKVRGAILIGVIVTTLVGIPLGVTQVPQSLMAVPSFADVGNIIFCYDFKSLFSTITYSLVYLFIVFVSDFFSTLGTIMAVGARTGMLDKDGNFPDIQKPFLVDAVGTVVGSAAGCTTITTYVESTAGVEEGGRTGLTAVSTGMMFFVAILFAPLFLTIPNAATGPALIFVGFMMLGGFTQIDFSSFTESFGPCVMVFFGAFTGTLASGISAGIIADVLIKVATGRGKDVHLAMYILCIPLILYFVVG